MKHEYDLESIKKKYEGFSDNKLKKIALMESGDLRPEVVYILLEELSKRGMPNHVLKTAATGCLHYEDAELDDLLEKISNLTCYNCSSNQYPVMGFDIYHRISLLIGSDTIHRELILCHSCGVKEKRISILKSVLLGWWSGKGLLLNIFTILGSISDLFFLKKTSLQILKKLIKKNTSNFRINGIENAVLYESVSKHNKSSY